MSDNSKKIGTAAKFILIGLLLLVIAMWWESSHEIHSFKEKILIGLIAHFAIGSLVIGILSILIETSHWVEYFKERLVEVVVDKKYIENLSEESLVGLQTEVLKAYYKDDDIAGKDGFLQYYQNNIQGFIASPFRTNVESDIRIEYLENDRSKILVHEVISWYCKANGGKIQDNITWEPDEGEFESVENVSFKIGHESFGSQFHERKNFKEEWKSGSNGFVFPLKDFIGLDGLKVTIISDVIVPVNKFMAWRMAHPSRGLSLSVRYPSDLLLKKELFGISDHCHEIDDKGKGYYKLSSTKWVLPDEGVVFQLSGKN